MTPESDKFNAAVGINRVLTLRKSRIAAYFAGIIVAVTLAATFFMYSVTRREVRTTQQMIEDASRLQIERASLKDVLAFARRYNGDATGSAPNTPCTESDCLVTAAPDKNDFWERHPKLGYAVTRISRRGWNFLTLMWVKNGRLVAIQQWFGYSSPQASPFIISSLSRPSSGLCRTPSYRLHRTFAAYPSPDHFNVWVSPAATHEKEILRLNVECVLSMSGCKGVADMVPAAWKVYEADKLLIDANDNNSEPLAGDPNCQ